MAAENSEIDNILAMSRISRVVARGKHRETWEIKLPLSFEEKRKITLTRASLMGGANVGTLSQVEWDNLAYMSHVMHCIEKGPPWFNPDEILTDPRMDTLLNTLGPIIIDETEALQKKIESGQFGGTGPQS